MLDRVGVKAERVGDSTGRLENIWEGGLGKGGGHPHASAFGQVADPEGIPRNEIDGVGEVVPAEPSRRNAGRPPPRVADAVFSFGAGRQR